MSCLCCDEYIELGCRNYCDTITFEFTAEDGQISGTAENRGDTWIILAEVEDNELTLDLQQLREFGLHELKFDELCYKITLGNY